MRRHVARSLDLPRNTDREPDTMLSLGDAVVTTSDRMLLSQTQSGGRGGGRENKGVSVALSCAL